MPAEQSFVVVPHDQLSQTALRSVIEAFIGREGTDYGAHEATWDSKVADVLRQLQAGSAHIVFDPVTESINIITADELARLRRGR